MPQPATPRHVLERELGDLGDIVRGHAPTRLPVVLTRQEVRSVMQGLRGVPWIVVALLYGAGLRLNEALDLRVKDIDLERQQILVRRGKGAKVSERGDELALAVRVSGGPNLSRPKVGQADALSPA